MTRRIFSFSTPALLAICLFLTAGCGSDATSGVGRSTGPTEPPTEPEPPVEPPPGEPSCSTGEVFGSTFKAIQANIFEQRGCTQQVCHGSSAAGGLDLSPDVAYQNLFQVDSVGSRWRLIEPGDKDRSHLWLKVAAKLDPSITVAGATMPSGLPPISEDELEALRLWIYAGAPENATVLGTEDLLGACLPEIKPIIVEPLDPPAAGEGIQFVLPPVLLKASSEHEICFATHYDFTDQVPDWAIDPTGLYFRFSGQELRQDPQSHHLVLIHADFDPDTSVDHPSFGTWTCGGGASHSDVCDPLDLGSCGDDGYCHSEIDPVSIGCIGYGPPGGGFGITAQQIGGAQEAQAFIEFREGVFGQMPLRGIAYWSSHAFNLTNEDTLLNGRINFPFAAEQTFPLQQIFNVEAVFSPTAAPYTEQTICNSEQLPQGARLFGLTSHTHEKGKYFWAELPDGTMIYENFIYNDPVKQFFSPELEFDSEDPADRRIRYCARYNNGMNADGSPNPELVTRSSRVPESARQTFGACEPVACAAGNIGAPCSGTGDDAACDSTPGASDGFCDACNITGGESTENEMFILIGQYFIDPAFPQPSTDGPVFAGLASVRSTSGD
ncbi:MAG: hypothetical protein P8R42_23555 [Candidatus Binatia bacterium]|nr:hypothetical protein [Candidatus Binatia bacterium]